MSVSFGHDSSGVRLIGQWAYRGEGGLASLCGSHCQVLVVSMPSVYKLKQAASDLHLVARGLCTFRRVRVLLFRYGLYLLKPCAVCPTIRTFGWPPGPSGSCTKGVRGLQTRDAVESMRYGPLRRSAMEYL